jgi:hypothetical protein
MMIRVTLDTLIDPHRELAQAAGHLKRKTEISPCYFKHFCRHPPFPATPCTSPATAKFNSAQ